MSILLLVAGCVLLAVGMVLAVWGLLIAGGGYTNPRSWT